MALFFLSLFIYDHPSISYTACAFGGHFAISPWGRLLQEGTISLFISDNILYGILFVLNKSTQVLPTKIQRFRYMATSAFFQTAPVSLGLAACSSDLLDAIDAFEYVGATGDVLEANGIDGGTAFDMDCDEGTAAKTVTCTGETADGRSVEAKGENFGEDNATLMVTVDGVILYDGLLKDAPGS